MSSPNACTILLLIAMPMPAPSAAMERRLDDGRKLACRGFVTETGQDTPERPNPSVHNMLRLGFQLAYRAGRSDIVRHRPNYLVK